MIRYRSVITAKLTASYGKKQTAVLTNKSPSQFACLIVTKKEATTSWHWLTNGWPLLVNRPTQGSLELSSITEDNNKILGQDKIETLDRDKKRRKQAVASYEEPLNPAVGQKIIGYLLSVTSHHKAQVRIQNIALYRSIYVSVEKNISFYRQIDVCPRIGKSYRFNIYNKHIRIRSYILSALTVQQDTQYSIGIITTTKTALRLLIGERNII